MTFRLHTDESESDDDIPLSFNSAPRAKPVAPPKDYTSRAARFRLWMLVAMLGLVIVAMREAGKPENWKWMGFDDAGKIKLAVDPALVIDRELADDGDQDVEIQHVAEANRNDLEQIESSAAVTADATGSSATELGPGVTLSETSTSKIGIKPPDNSPPYPRAAARFWANLIRKLDADQHQDLYRILRSLRTGKSLEPKRIDHFRKLVAIIQQQRKRFHRDLLDQLSILPGGSEEKKQLANELYESEQLWDTKVEPALVAAIKGEDFTISQQQQIEKLQALLDPLIFARIEDNTTIGWAGDSPAWVRMWEQILATVKTPPVRVTHLQLSSQPTVYRGRLVSVSGTVLSAVREQREHSELGVANYFQLLVQPADSKISPYFIYALQLPQGFPAVSDRYSAMEVPIAVTGLFFKNRSYVNGAKKVGEAPVLLAQTISVIPATTIATNPAASLPKSIGTWLMLFAIMAALAALIAWRAFAGTNKPRFQPSVKSTKKIHQTLQGLVDDPAVQTDAEKIRQLYE